MSRYIKIINPNETRKALLIGKINSLKALKRCQTSITSLEKVKADLGALNEQLSIIPASARSIKGKLPKVDITKAEKTRISQLTTAPVNTPVRKTNLNAVEDQIAALEAEIGEL